MEPVNLPPRKISLPSLLKAAGEQRSKQNEDRLEPHVLFLPYDVSRRMGEQLKKENSDIHMFVHQACIKHLNEVDNDKQALSKWMALSELQLSEHTGLSSWSYNEEDENIFKQPRFDDEEGE